MNLWNHIAINLSHSSNIYLYVQQMKDTKKRDYFTLL